MELSDETGYKNEICVFAPERRDNKSSRCKPIDTCTINILTENNRRFSVA